MHCYQMKTAGEGLGVNVVKGVIYMQGHFSQSDTKQDTVSGKKATIYQKLINYTQEKVWIMIT